MKKRTLLIISAIVAAVIVLSCVSCLVLRMITSSSPTYKAAATARAIAATTEAARPTDAPLLTYTPALSQMTAKVTAPALNVRAGPSTDYTIVGKLSLDDSVEVVGRNAASDWLQIVYPEDSDGRAWIAAAYADLTGSLATVPEVSAPPTATPEPAPALSPGTEVELVDPEGGGSLVGDVGIYYMGENCEYLDVAHDFVASGTRAVIASWEVCYPERADNLDNARQYYYKVIIPSQKYKIDNSWVNAKYVIVVPPTDTPLPLEP